MDTVTLVQRQANGNNEHTAALHIIRESPWYDESLCCIEMLHLPTLSLSFRGHNLFTVTGLAVIRWTAFGQRDEEQATLSASLRQHLHKERAINCWCVFFSLSLSF